ncbi:MAG: Do family serine endopeptidase [Cytophagales bacterium]|nr:Do family serine endopeptidase [Rhizobacter sp.]
MRSSISVASPALGRRAFQRFAAVLAAAAALSLAAALAPQASHAQMRDLPDFADLVERVGPAVVNIRTTERATEGPRSPFRRRAPALQGADEVPRGEGSGFILSADGYVMTNAHVIEGATEVYVTLTDKREFKAKVVGADERTDVALVKIDATGLPVLRIGDVNRLRVGEWVVAIGSPFGLENSVSAGIVSAKQRETGSDVPFIQTDVAVNPGNSGGPLINIRGEAVGINSQILSPVGSFIGISFAIPIDEAMRIADQLKATGRVVRGYLGIQPTDVPREWAEEYGLNKAKTKGAFVRQVVPAGPADKAGIQPGDVVLSVNGKAVDGAVDLRRTLGALKPGSSVSLQISRRGKLMEFKPNLAEMNSQVAASERPEGDARTSTAARVWGLTAANLTDAERQALRGVSGVRVTAVAAGAEAVGLRAGDVILAVGAADVADLKQFDAVVSKLDKARALPVTVLRGEWAQFLRIPVVK